MATSVMNIMSVDNENRTGRLVVDDKEVAGGCIEGATSESELIAAPHSQQRSWPICSWALQIRQCGTVDEASASGSIRGIGNIGLGQMSYAASDLAEHDACHHDCDQHDEFMVAGHAKFGLILAKRLRQRGVLRPLRTAQHA